MKLHHAGVPWLLEVNAPLVLERQQYEALKGWKLRWAKSWERDVLQSAPVLVAVSRWLCQWLKEEVGCKGKILHLPNGVEPVAGEREKTRQRLGLEGRFVVGFLGSMKPWHGVLRLPDLLDRIPEAVGLCVGEGPVQIEHPRLIKTGQVSEAEAASLVAAMDVGLAPYGKEAPPWFCPLKILAYRAQGTPVVASDTGDCRELVGEAGSIVAVDAEISEWAEAVLSWKNRRCLLRVRSWEQVVAEAMAAL
jgi:glycosyltransferase involved in cell wall biosynthesis